MSRRPVPAADRFWAKVDTSEDCWLWTAYCDKDGYGRFSPSPGSTAAAHRVSLELAGVSIPEGLVVDHTCHARSCVRPTHLRLITQKQNCENRLGAQRDNASSGVRGVSWSKHTNKWEAYVRHHGVRIALGHFQRLEDAEAVVVAKRLELFTHNDTDRQADAA